MKIADASITAAADYVIQNGTIYTVSSEQPWAEALAITGQDIVYVGENEGAQAYKGKDTIVADLRGRFTMPGIVSSH
jgi:predicted amidohydrolase YtcJ